LGDLRNRFPLEIPTKQLGAPKSEKSTG
jgi:hypothetical protein